MWYCLLTVVALYPVIGLLRGHNVILLIYPRNCALGSIAFALVVLCASLPYAPKAAYVLLLLRGLSFAPFCRCQA